jgi:GNAT superfamily N-acetyltransferase
MKSAMRLRSSSSSGGIVKSITALLWRSREAGVGYGSRVWIREARAGDWPEVSALLAELGRPDVRGTEDEEAARRHFESYLQRADTEAFVAELDGRVVGFVNVEFRPRLNFTTPEAWVPELIVGDAARGKGAGAALLGRCEEVARERDCWSLSLESANWRERAHAFYLREGFDDLAHAFVKVLADVEWPPKPRP